MAERTNAEAERIGRGRALELRGVSKRYGTLAALSDVSLTVQPGEFLTLLGPSGCGKTTLLKAVAGFVPEVEGAIFLGGKPLEHVPPYRRNIGVVFQNYALFPHYTVADNVAFGLKMRKFSRAEIRGRVADALRLVQLEELAHRYPKQLSGGQQQRVALARVLAINPELLLLDEPFGALDRKLRVEMQVEVKQLLKPLGITTIFVTHDQEEAMTLSDRIAVMHRGRIAQCAEPLEIYDRPATAYVADFVGITNFLPARVITAGSNVCIEASGAMIELPFPADATPGDGAVLAVRPENLFFSDAGGDSATWAGRLTFAIPAGPTMEYEVTIESGARLHVSTGREGGEGELARRIGSPVHIRVANPARCRLFRAGAAELA